jgi:methionyl-tRNA synthetase
VNNCEIKITVAPELAAKGIKVKAAAFSVKDIPRKQGGALEKHIKQIIASLPFEEMLKSPLLEQYRRLQREAGIAEPAAPAESLLKLIQRSGRLPNINRVVDCYNLASAQTLMSMGAHDISKIKGDIRLVTTDGTEKYTPLGQTSPEKIAPGEYAAMDDEKILCRLDMKQCDETKCGKDTRDILVYVQGNAETSDAEVLKALEKVRDLFRDFCGAEWQMLQ